jgi:DNA-binding transcriptional LysR family regulator
MTARGATRVIRIVFDAGMPTARWGPLFHVFRLEHPDLRLEWQPTGFPIRGRSLLEGADAGLFVEPPPEAGRSALTLDVSPMVVIVAAGDRLAHNTELRVADILDRPFPGGPNLNPEWTSFWTLDEQRGGPATRTADDVRSAEDGLEVIAAQGHRHPAHLDGRRSRTSGRDRAPAPRRPTRQNPSGLALPYR